MLKTKNHLENIVIYMIWENGRMKKAHFLQLKKKKLFQEETNIKEKKTKTRVIIIKKFIQDLDFECEDA